MTTKSIQPVSTPDEIRTLYEEKNRELLNQVVVTVNLILALPDSLVLLHNKQSVAIYDNSNSPAWIYGHKTVVDLYRVAGWLIEESPDSTEKAPRYLFRLPEEGVTK